MPPKCMRRGYKRAKYCLSHEQIFAETRLCSAPNFLGNIVAPTVLISDALSPEAVAIFNERGIQTDFEPSLGQDKNRLAAVIGNFDGLAVRSATKVTAK